MTNQSPSAPGAAPAAAGSSLSQTQQHHSHDDDNSILSSPHSVDSSPDHDPDSRSHSLSHAHSHLHSHSHSHSHSQSTHSHLHSSSSSRHHDASGDDNRGDSHNHQDEPNSDVSDQSLELRQAGADDQPAQDDPWETRVVQTIELIQVVDHSGNPVSTSTNYVEPNTVVVDRVSGKTAAISAPGSSRTAPASSPEAGHHGSSPPSSRTYRPPVTYSTTTHSVSQSPTSQPTASPTYSPSGSVTSPVSSPPPISSGVLHNNTISGNATLLSESLMSKSLRKLSSSHLSATSFTSTSDEEFSSTYSTGSDSSYTTWTDGPTSTTEIGGWVEGTGRNSEPTNPSDSTSSSGGAGDLSHQEKQIVGGVVGSVAGVAFLLLLALMAIKYKKRRNDVQELIGDQGVGSRAITAGPASGGDGGSGAAAPMAERSGANPFGVPAALASLTGKNNAPPVAGTGERGFVRVSGKKLPSVLQHGGDGYSDPRGSVMSGESDYYRGSQAFEPGAGAHHLALGAPMRPVSGVPIMRSGPSRTAVTQENPFADDPFADPPSPPPPPPPRDPLGRSLGSQDGSRGSGSKFQENI